MGRTIDPLPRSVEPLPGESLVSYLLRLGNRLGLSPLHLIRSAGWTEHAHPHHVPGSLLLDLPGPQADAFARLTRQTVGEVSALTLAQWRDRYPPIARSTPSPGRQLRPDTWLFVGSPRFCPSCLAGDSTPAQQLHGGPWRKLWHLPVVFACVEHQTYLQAGCPHCGQPRSSSGHLIQRVNDHTLHPAQCRWTIDAQTQKRKSRACAGRLDQLVARARDDLPQPTADVLRFQESLLARLAPPTPATDASQYFTDLRLIATLITTSWPQGKHLFDAASTEGLDSYVRVLNASAGTRLGRRIVDAPPPRDPVVCSVLLQAAQRVLATDDLSGFLSRFVQAAFNGKPSQTPWARLLARHENDCSKRLREAAEPVTRAFRKVGGRRGTRAPVRDDYRPEHIPAFLASDWHQRHLAHLSGQAPKLIRRAAAVRLVQWAMGGSQGDAATFLGINPDRLQFKTASSAWLWGRVRCDPLAFDAALRELASELRRHPRSLIDYQRRRSVLQHWVLDRETWDALISELPPVPGPIRPVVDDRKRQDASVFIWTQVTQGEHLFAPRPIEAAQPQRIQQAWTLRRNTTWFQLTRPDPMGHYAQLRKSLAEYAQQLARNIDSGIGQGHLHAHAQ